MRIYRMEATFGKLEGQSLTLDPGLNIIQAHNEWGKSTWCAFLGAMLYGLDTQAKSTKTALADKERYAPWSGSPMAGRIDLNWQGRDITIERTTRGRIPMGEFRAYETASGIRVPELTAANCGQLLLGVEQSVYRRSGFIRLADLPVTQDEALRRRLNALVTTGDESGDGEKLERGLRELKNKCRYNRTGAIPQAQTELEALDQKLKELDTLQSQVTRLEDRHRELDSWLIRLRNHQAALHYAAALDDEKRVAQARQELSLAQKQYEQLEDSCARLPSREEARRKLHSLQQFREELAALEMELAMEPEEPEAPVPPPVFEGMDPDQARLAVEADTRRYDALKASHPGLPWFLPAILCFGGAASLAVWKAWWIMAGGIALGLLLILLGLLGIRRNRRALDALEEKYGTPHTGAWGQQAEEYARAHRRHAQQLLELHRARGDLDARAAALDTRRQSLCGSQTPDRVEKLWQQVLRRLEDRDNAQREVLRCGKHLDALQAMAKTAERPAAKDDLTQSPQETAALISNALEEQQRLTGRMGQYRGRMETLGDRTLLQQQRSRVQSRIDALEQTWRAADLGLRTLEQARRELQRRFAPQITKRAQELMERFTHGRYRKLTMGEDFRLSASAESESVLWDALWRSDGTVDQLYLALRLAVAEALMPQAPLVLDDALVRFDDRRLKAALEILEELSQNRQILLFTCQSRENRILEEG